jgi:SAM-dependent methyltransferase
VASAGLARSFGGSAAEYERVRPDWPPAAVDRAVALLGLGRDAEVVDLGAGTGKLTRLLAERFARVVAVDPDERMRALLDTEAYHGTAEDVPLPDDSVDAVAERSELRRRLLGLLSGDYRLPVEIELVWTRLR